MLLSFALPTLAHIGMLVLLVLGFGFVIFWHELGHFFAAKWVGIRVEQFAVGFGPAIFAWRKGIGFRVGSTQKDFRERAEQHLLARGTSAAVTEKSDFSDIEIANAADELHLGETEYRLNWIPLGGYVKMLGQDDLKPDAQAEDPRAYNRKSISARMLVISAGVIMNIILAAIGFMVLFLIGFNVPPAWVGNVLPGSPAQKAGMHVGDHILYFNDKWEADFTKITLDTALVKENAPVKMIVSRPDRPGDRDTTYHNVELTVTPTHAMGDARFLAIGFAPPHALRGDKKDDSSEVVSRETLLKSAPADALLIGAGDVITAVNGEPMNLASTVDGKPVQPEDYVKFDLIMQNAHGKPISLTIKGDDGKVREQQMFQPHFEDPFNAYFDIAGLHPRVAIAAVAEASPLIGKVLPMDVVLSIKDGDPWPNPSRETFMKRIEDDGNTGHLVTLDVLRNGKIVTIADVKATLKVAENRKGFGVGTMVDEMNPVVADVVAQSPAANAGLKGGDTITAINGSPVANWYDIHRILSELTLDKDAKTAIAKVTYTRPQVENPQEAELKLGQDDLDNVKAMRYQSMLALTELDVKRQTSHPLIAASWGITETRDFTLQFYLTLRRMVDRSISPSNMMGPVGIFVGGKAFAYKGIDWLIWFLSMISANLAVVNFLPIPVVDGGQFVFLLFEKIKGKPLSPRAMAVAQYAGLAFLAAVVLFVTYHDILRNV